VFEKTSPSTSCAAWTAKRQRAWRAMTGRR
jgi:hypothetical protein